MNEVRKLLIPAVAIAVACWMLSGCEGRLRAEAKQPASERIVAGDKSDWLSPGKPQAPVDISHAIDGEPRAGETLSIDVMFSPRVDVQHLQVSFSAKPEVGLLDNHADIDFAARGAGEVVTQRLSITPSANGLHYVNVIARVATGDSERARSYAIPVQVGSVAALSEPTHLKIDGSGQKIIVLPAEESGD